MGYVSMHVAIRRKYLKSGGRAGHFHDGFRDTPFITCKSPSESSQAAGGPMLLLFNSASPLSSPVTLEWWFGLVVWMWF